VNQLSKPFQYTLVLLLVLAGAWLLVLRPSDDDDGSDSPPAAVATPAAAAAATTSPPAAATPVAKPGRAPAAGTGDPSKPILDAIGDGKVAVVLFYEDAASDDRAVRRSVRALPRHGGRVAVFLAPIADIGHYQAITRGASVQSAPTVLIVSADGSARAITGYTDAKEIDQYVSDALKRPAA